MSSITFDIRRASLNDVDLLCVLGARTFRETYPLAVPDEMDEYVATHFSAARIETHLGDSNSYLLIASLSGRAIGYAHLRVAHAPPCVTGAAPVELARLYLDTGSQGAGYGAALMRAVLDEARRWARKTMWLGVYSENPKARAFYTAWGFKDVGFHDFEIGGKVYSDPVMSRAVDDGVDRTPISPSKHRVP